MPVGVDSGDWRATVNFKWDGKNISGAVCGDMDITQEVKGDVWSDRYAVAGGHGADRLGAADPGRTGLPARPDQAAG